MADAGMTGMESAPREADQGQWTGQTRRRGQGQHRGQGRGSGDPTGTRPRKAQAAADSLDTLFDKLRDAAVAHDGE
jgi:hypothetical protein